MLNLKRIGIFGGSFNPVDKAHITIVQEFVSQLELEKCYIIPTFISPFKSENYYEIPVEHRLKMLEIAFSGNPVFEIDKYEIEKGGISYTYDTIKYIKKKHADSNLYLLIGSDQAVNFKDWKNWKRILKIVQLCIAMRPGFSSSSELTNTLNYNGKKPFILKSPLINISATEIRDKIRNGESINNLVPIDIESYIKNHSLYK